MPYSIRRPEDRDRLDVRDKPYYEPVSDALHIGYRKGKFKRSWVVRRRTPTGYETETIVGATPDDIGLVSTSRPISFEQMEKRIKDSKEHTCSFCDRGAHEVEQLVAGPGVYICNRCNDLVALIIKHPHSPDTHAIKLDDAGRAIIDRDGVPVIEPLV